MQTTIIDAEEGEVSELADTSAEEKTLNSSMATKSKVPKKIEEEDSSDSRFKLRNGREVGFYFSFLLNESPVLYCICGL